MFKLLSVFIVAGVFESSQQVIKPYVGVKPFESNQQVIKPYVGVKPFVPLPLPCDYPTHIQCWTDWFDRDNPSGTGDWEDLPSLRKKNPGKICPKPAQIEAQTLSGLSQTATGDVISQSDTISGFVCENWKQPKGKMCNDYKVRFSCHPPFCGGGVCWTNWYDRDDPSGTGDWELLTNLRQKYPIQICEFPLYIEAVTTDTNTPAISTGEILYIYNPTQGFVCRKDDQPDKRCRDYKVRFGCPCKEY